MCQRYGMMFVKHFSLQTKLVHDIEDKLPLKVDIWRKVVKGGLRMIWTWKQFSCGTEITNGNGKLKSLSKRSDAIDKLAQELREKHGEAYSMPQYCLRARMKIICITVWKYLPKSHFFQVLFLRLQNENFQVRH